VRESSDKISHYCNDRIIAAADAAAEAVDKSFDAFDRRKRSSFVDEQWA